MRVYNGLASYGTRDRGFRQAARYLALHAKPNAMICRYESLVTGGAQKEQHRFPLAVFMRLEMMDTL